MSIWHGLPGLAVVMASSSDWERMQHACTIPDDLFGYAASARERGLAMDLPCNEA